MSRVQLWEETVEIPNYETGKEDINPMFLEKRVYQGSSGKVYPYPVIDKIYDEKVMKPYKIIVLENKYLRVEILPELGGKIYRALDKTNNYDFVYYNKVIKPALVGLTGPWTSGGIEFNWPQHHRPNTFGKVEYTFGKDTGASRTLYIGETDRMYGTKVTTSFTLYEDKAYIEIGVQLYNPTSEYQTFLWWANPAVSVNDKTQSIFPPDVNAVFDHGKRDVSKFPIATGVYYKMDYSHGVDISKYSNIPVPTSYMAYHSEFDFVGGYDYEINAGILHVADHHIAPGKKQWTWGCGDFGKAWDRNLTDEDGPYIELMTGVYTDNQPDFTFLMPYEEKSFKQYFMPYKGVGQVKNATKEIMIGLDIKGDRADVKVYAASELKDIKITLRSDLKIYFEENISLSPLKAYEKTVEIDGEQPEENNQIIISGDDKEILAFSPLKKEILKMPDPAVIMEYPETIKTTEELYLAGMHLEQYRHATYEPEKYYAEGLKREPGNIRINNAYGNLLFRRGDLEGAISCFNAAIKALTKFNTNPYDGESFYNLGKALKYGGNYKQAYDAYYKAIWSSPYQCAGYYHLGQIASIWKDYEKAVEFVDKSLEFQNRNYRARNLKAIILRKIGKYDESVHTLVQTIEYDPMDVISPYELSVLYKSTGQSKKHKEALESFKRITGGNRNNYILSAQFYMEAGFYEEAIDILALYVDKIDDVYPMVYYHLAFCQNQLGNIENAKEYLKKADASNSDYCFANSLWDLKVLEYAIEEEPKLSKAYYYLGNLLYDKKRYEYAMDMWEKSTRLDNSFPTAYRNLALGYYNKQFKPNEARAALERAFALNEKDARVFYELDQLYKKISMPIEERLVLMENHFTLVSERDDLYVEYLTLLNLLGKHEKVIELILIRKFHPWEGSEGKIPSQYIIARVELAKKLLKERKYDEAIKQLEEAKIYPENIGEGKLIFANENNIDYYIGIVNKEKGDFEKAKYYFLEATKGKTELAGTMFYNDLPPEMIFYKGLAYLELGEINKAKSEFNKLISYGEDNIFVKQSIDYFAVSLPDFIVFEEDLDTKNYVHCYFMMGLGHLGLNDSVSAEKYFSKALALHPYHQQLLIHKEFSKN